MPDVPRELAFRYVEVRSPLGVWIARRDCAEGVERGEADFLFEERGSAPVEAGSGRGPIAHFRLAGRPVIGKRALHGGLLGPLLAGLYLGNRRALDQAKAAARLESAGVPTPEILAVGSAAVLGPARTHAIVSRELQGAINLFEVAGGMPTRRRRRDLLLECSDLLRRMHDAGFLHADLNVSNLVLERRGKTEVLHVVDLDRGRFRGVVSPRHRLRTLARLLRSYEKWIAARLRLSRREEILFLVRYARGDRAMVRFLAKSLSRRRRLWFCTRRIRWRITVPHSKDRIAGPLE